MYKRQWLLLALISICSHVLSQETLINTTYYGIDDGLSHREVFCVLQDKEGVLWFGTQYGLNRFDGYKFSWYTKEKHGLSTNVVSDIHEDKEGNLWLIQKPFVYQNNDIQHIDIFNVKTKISVSFDEYFAEKAPFKLDELLCYDQNKDGDFLFLTRQYQLYIYDGHFKKQASIVIDGGGEINEMWWAPNGWVWVVQSQKHLRNKQLLAYNARGELIHHLHHEGADGLRVFELVEDGSCHYLSIKREGDDALLYTEVYTIKPDGTQTKHPLNDNPVFRAHTKNCFFPFQYFAKIEDQIWMSVGHLEMLEMNETALDKALLSFSIGHISDVLVDRYGFVWVTTSFGIYKLKIKPNKFTKVLHDNEEFVVATRDISMDDNGHLWIVNDGRRVLWDITLDSNNVLETKQLFYKEISLPIPYIFYGLIKRENGKLCFFSQNEFIQFEPESLDYQRDTLSLDKDGIGICWALYEDENNNIWLTTSEGKLGVFDGSQTIWLTGLEDEMLFEAAYHFHKDKNGRTWLISDGGLYELDVQNIEILHRYWSGGKGKYYFPFDNIYHLHEDDEGVFWLGTGGTGLIRWEGVASESNQYQQFTRADGLDNVIYGVYEDEYDNLWMPSDNGIIRFNKTTHQTKTYQVEDGTTHNEFNRLSHFQAKDGRLFFGSLNGITLFHPKDFLQDSVYANAPMIITDFQLINRNGNSSEGALRLFQTQQTIKYSPTDRFFRLGFALLNYQDVKKNRYAYKIEGIDKDWNYQKENFIRFSRLPYGHHTLRIKGQDDSGQWSVQELEINLQIIRPIYLQTWFVICVIITMTGLVFFFIRWRTRQLLKQQQLLQSEVNRQTQEIRQQAEEIQSLEKLKSRFFANVSHELRTPLSLMLGPLESILKKDLSKEKRKKLAFFAYKNSRHLLKLVNEILDLSKLETNKLEVKYTAVNLHEFLQAMMSQFSSFSDDNSVRLQFDYRLNHQLKLQLDIDKFEKIVHNYLSNAIKFTPNKERVYCIIDEVDAQILISVIDQGPGVHPDDLPYIFDRFYQSKRTDTPPQGGTGIGLSLCKELAVLLEGKVWVESEYGKGSAFYFQFPKIETDVKAVEAISKHDEQLMPSIEEQENRAFPIREKLVEGTIEVSKGKVNGVSVSKPNILIVEDNHDLRNYILSLLEEDYTVFTAENGQAALEKINELQKNTSVQLIISDLMMPVMDGFEFLEIVKKDDALRHIPFIMLTARADVKVKLKVLRVGIDDYIVKPFVESELIMRIKNLLNNLNERIAGYVQQYPQNSTSLEKPVIGQADANWLEAVEEVLTKVINDRQLNFDWVATQMHLSKRQLHRKIKELTGLTPNMYLREIRLQQAREYLLHGKFLSVKEVSFAVGFSDTKYFSKLFKERFGILPSEQLN